MIDNKKYSDFALVGLNVKSTESIEQYFTIQYHRWLFKFSDKVTIDGKELTPDDKRMIRLALYNIKPKPKEILSSDITSDGIKLTEKNFIQTEIEKVKQLKRLSPITKLKRDEYLKFLYNKLKTYETEKKKNIVRITKNKTFPFYCQIGALFAQGFIKKDKFDYYYNDIKFNSAYALSIYIKKDILKTDKTVKNYINDTLNNGKKIFTLPK